MLSIFPLKNVGDKLNLVGIDKVKLNNNLIIGDDSWLCMSAVQKEMDTKPFFMYLIKIKNRFCSDFNSSPFIAVCLRVDFVCGFGCSLVSLNYILKVCKSVFFYFRIWLCRRIS